MQDSSNGWATFPESFQVAGMSYWLEENNQSIIRHLTLLDGCIAPMRVIMALVFDPVGRLMQLLCAPQIWAL